MLKLISACDSLGLPRCIAITGDQITIGRQNSNGIQNFVQLSAESVGELMLSRTQARITRAGGFILSDAHSTNGTFVNGQRVDEPKTLQPGDVVSFAFAWTGQAGDECKPYVYIFDPAEAEPEAPPPMFQMMMQMAAPPPLAPTRARDEDVPPPAYAPRSVEALRAPPELVEKLSEMSACNVCLDTMVAPHVLTNCGHNFCGECIFRWLRQQGKTSCPTCRADAGEPAYNKIVDDLLQMTLVPTLTPERAEERAGREERWHLANHTFAKKRRREDEAQHTLQFMMNAAMAPLQHILVPQMMRAVLRRTPAVMAAMRPVTPPSPRARELYAEAIERVANSPSNGRWTVGYSLGVPREGGGRMAATCRACSQDIALGEPQATPRRDPASTHHTRCCRWSRLPLGLQTLRCEDTGFIATHLPGGELGELLYD